MVKKGIYRDSKIHTHEPALHTFGSLDYVVYDVERTLDWWPKANQEVEFELLNGKAIIKSLGNILKPVEADIYCRSF